MAGQVFSSGVRINKVTLTTGHAGARTGASAVDGAAGATNSSQLTYITLGCTDASLVDNTFRIWVNNGGTKSLVRSISLRASSFVNGQAGEFTMDIPINRKLPNGVKCCYDIESTQNFDIMEEFVDF